MYSKYCFKGKCLWKKNDIDFSADKTNVDKTNIDKILTKLLLRKLGYDKKIIYVKLFDKIKIIINTQKYS